jgi:hypothetical protein
MAAPLGCPGCPYSGFLHRQGYYPRYLSDLQERMWVAWFICPRCGKTTSCLPSFALPYRHVRVETVAAFLAGRQEDAGVQRHWDLLQRYWRGFQRWWRQLAQGVGMRFGNQAWKDARAFWDGMMVFCGGLESASHGLLWEFGLGVFFRYRVHGWARRSRCRMGMARQGPRWDSG